MSRMVKSFDTTQRIDGKRLIRRLDQLARIGKKEDGSCCRLALTDEDRMGRDQVVAWMRELGMEVRVDRIGNIFGLRKGSQDLPPVMTGSHIDTVATGGRLDGNYGVLAGLEVVQTLNEANVTTDRPLVVAVFMNEEGVRYQPDMLGSLVYAGGLSVEEAHAVTGIDGSNLGSELKRIGYAGEMQPGAIVPKAFVELAHRAGSHPGCARGKPGRGKPSPGHLLAGGHDPGGFEPRGDHAHAVATRCGIRGRPPPVLCP